MKLNAEQTQAVEHFDGPCIVTAVPGSGKCIRWDSWVFSDSIKLSQIKNNKVSTVLGLEKENLSEVAISPRPISSFIDSGRKPVIKISSKHGFSLIGTYHHPIVVMGHDGKLSWKTLETLKIGDYAAIWCNKNCDLSRIANSIDIKWYLMGLLFGDGYLTHPKYIGFCAQHELRTTFCSMVDSLYGCLPNVYPDKRRDGLYNIYVSNKQIKEDLSKVFGDVWHGSCDKQLTDNILSGNDLQITSFLSGLFDTDGYASENSCGITLCSKTLVDQLHLLLLHYGVFSTKTTRKINDNFYYKIEIYGDNYRRFVKNIGFKIGYKKERSIKILDKKVNSNKIIPFAKNILQDLRSSIRDYEWWDGHTATVFSEFDSVCMHRYLIDGPNTRNITDDSALRIADICRHHGFESIESNYLKQIAENLVFTEIVSIDRGKDEFSDFSSTEHVMDYEVSESHSFIANGFINHNTKTLTSRVVRLIERKVDPRNLLCLTFTNKAANEMKERVALSVGQSASQIWISTFHSFFLAILRKYGNLIGVPSNFSVYDDKDQAELIEKIGRMHEFTTNRAGIQKIVKVANDCRENLQTLQDFGDLVDVEAAIITEYYDTLKTFNAVDFSGILYRTYELLKNHESVRQTLNNRFKYILGDEWQDTNTIQYESIKMLASHGNLFVVADRNQCVRSGQRVMTNINEFKSIEQLSVGDEVLSCKGNAALIKSKIVHINKHSTFGLETQIKTRNGNSLRVTANHQMFVKRGYTQRANLVYLMLKNGKFRIGTSQIYEYNSGLYNGFWMRCRSEKAECGWIINYWENEKDARIEEKRLSYKYGLPTETFLVHNCGMFNQVDLDTIHANCDSARGAKLLAIDFGLDLNNPLWSKDFTRCAGDSSFSITLLGDSRAGILHRLCVRSSSVDFITECENKLGIKFKASRDKKVRLTKRFDRVESSLKNILELREKMAEIAVNLGINFRKKDRAKITETDPLDYCRADSLMVGDLVPVVISGRVVLDEVIEVATLPCLGTYYDFEIENSHNFISEGIIHSNSIFSWRGAKPENLDRMKKDFPGVQEITLPRNYRSTARILKSAQNLIRKNEDARSVELISVKGDGHDVAVRTYVNPEQEASIIARSIQEMKERFGYGWNSFAILYRTNILSKLPEMAMRHAGIPYRIYGGFSFFDRSEIKTSLAYLSFLANEHDTVAFSRAIQYPKRQIGPAVIGRLERVCQTEKISMLAACRRADYLSGIPQNGRKNLDEFLQAVEKFRKLQDDGERLGRLAADFLQETGYYDFMKTESEKDEDFRRRVDNIDELLLSIADFEIQKPNAKLSDYLQSVELLTSGTNDKEEDAVTLLTMHSAKGLEFPVVFIIGCEKDIVPHKSAIIERGEDEERRLFYVAMTRAEERLFLSHCQMRRSFSLKSKTNQQKPCSPSKFLSEMSTSDTWDILDDEIAHL